MSLPIGSPLRGISFTLEESRKIGEEGIETQIHDEKMGNRECKDEDDDQNNTCNEIIVPNHVVYSKLHLDKLSFKNELGLI